VDYEADAAMAAIDSGVSRIKGLYAKFAQENEIPYGLIQVSYVLKFNSPVTQKQISEICEIPKQTVNGIVKQLKADKYISVTPSKDDKREKEIRLTPLGEEYVRDTLSPFFELNKMVTDRISMSFIEQLIQGLAKLGDVIEMEIELKKVSSKWENKFKAKAVSSCFLGCLLKERGKKS